MGTARSTSASSPTPPRKRAPRKATASRTAKAPAKRPVTASQPPAVAQVDEPPAPVDPAAERLANLRRMLAEEGIDPDAVLASQPPAEPEAETTPAPVDPAAERLANLRRMLAEEGIDPDAVLASQPPAVAPAVAPAPAPADPAAEPAPAMGRDFEPIPGVDLDAIRNIIVDARRTPATADTVIDGLRALLVDNGYDPDVIIPVALGEDTTTAPGTTKNGLINAVVPFRGRKIVVTAPEIEQVMVIRRMQSLFANAAKMEQITADEAVRLMDRALKAVCSVIVDPDDVEFLEDLLLTRQAKIEDTLPLLRESLKALEQANAGNGNRAERRATAKSSGRTGRATLDTACE
jgi:hypothetical protein